jgi:hypothetical protein
VTRRRPQTESTNRPNVGSVHDLGCLGECHCFRDGEIVRLTRGAVTQLQGATDSGAPVDEAGGSSAAELVGITGKEVARR